MPLLIIALNLISESSLPVGTGLCKSWAHLTQTIGPPLQTQKSYTNPFKNNPFSGPIWIMISFPCYPRRSTAARLFTKSQLIVVFGARPLAAPKNILKSIKTSKNHTSDAQGFNFDALLVAFWISFSINFRDRLHLLNCNTFNANTSFLQFQDFQFGILKQ